MSFFEAIPLVLLGIVGVLMPVLAIGLTASKLHPQERTGLALIYGGAVFQVGVIAADVSGALPDRWTSRSLPVAYRFASMPRW